MSKQNVLKKDGMIIEALPSGTFRVKADDGFLYLVHLSGKMRINRIRLIPGDRVIIELPSDNSERGRIIYRK